MLSRIESTISKMEAHFNQASGARDLLLQKRAGARLALERAKQDIATWEQVQMLFTLTSEYAREQLKARIEETVTAALQAVFTDESLEFKIDIRELSGKPAAEWQVISHYSDVSVAANPEDARGGGITDVVSLALRLAMMELTRPKPQGPVILDEPGKMISREYLPNVAYFLKQYAERSGRQIILITHAEPLAEIADVTYRVSQRDGVSEVRQDAIHNNRGLTFPGY